MELVGGVPQKANGLICEISAKYPPYYKTSEKEKWDRINGKLFGRFSVNDLTSSFTGTNRNVIDVNGLMITLPASVSAIDHIGNALEPTIRLEPAAANILLEVLTDWTDTTLTPVKNAVSWAGAANGAYTVTASGANGTLISTAVSATSAAFTFVCAIKRSVGTGAVSMTIDNGSTWTEKTLTTSFQYFNVTKTAANPQLGFKLATSGDAIIVDCLILVPNTAIASSYFAPAAAIGAELVTDGGFDAVTEGAERITVQTDRDFSGDSNWNRNSMPTWNETGDLSIGSSAAAQNTWLAAANIGLWTAGNCYKIQVTASNLTGAAFWLHIGGGGSQVIFAGIVDGTQTAYINYAGDGNGNFVIESLGTGTVDLDNFTIKEITFASWTAGTGWAPQATAGSLTGKAQKVAGTASALAQTTAAAEADNVYRIGHTAVRTAGTYTAEFGSTNGTAVAANGLYYDYIIAADTDYIKFNADASFAGSIDLATGKKHGTVRLSEANTITLAIPAAVTAAIETNGVGTVVVKGRFAFTRAAGVVTNVMSSEAATASLIYTTTAAGNITSNDGTTIAENTGAYTANVDWKIALKFPSDTDKYRIGIDVDGAGIAWGAEVAFDGAINATANLILGYVLHGATWIKWIKIYNKVLTDAHINEMS